jgi:hypothetical protein
MFMNFDASGIARLTSVALTEPSVPPSAPVELVAGPYSLVTLGFALIHFDLTAALLLLFYTAGYLIVDSSTLREALVRRKLPQKAD